MLELIDELVAGTATTGGSGGGSTGGDVITAINNTGSAITSGDKVWINKSSISKDSATTNTGGQNTGCIISPDGSKVYCTQYEGGDTSRPYNIYDITDINNIQVFSSGTFASGFNTVGMVLGYTDAGNVTITWPTYSSAVNSTNLLMLKRNGDFVRTKIGTETRNFAIYLGGNYWASQTSGSVQLIQYNEDTNTQTQIAASSWSKTTSTIYRGCYNPSTGIILGKSFPYSVSGTSISLWSSTSSIYSEASYSGGFANQGSLFIGNQSQNAGAGSTANGEFRVATWDGQRTQSQISLSSIGLGDIEGMSVWPLYNQYTKILTVASCFGTDYKVYRYDESNNYFNEITIQLNTEGNKFVGPISFSEDLKKCAYTCIPSTDSSISSNYANVKYMIEEVEVAYVAVSYSNITQNSLTGYAQENIASGSTGDVLTLLG